MMQDSGGILPGNGKLDPTGLWRICGYRLIWGGKLADKHGAVPALKFIFRRTVCSAVDGLPVLTASTQYARWLPFW